MKTTTKRSFTSKKGITINAGERVTVSFSVKGKHVRDDVTPFLPNYVRLTTEDGRSIITRNFKGAGIRVPGVKTLERYAWDSVVESVFGNNVEPDGWDHEGSPSWLLVFGII
jgi:hypothetical protein